MRHPVQAGSWGVRALPEQPVSPVWAHQARLALSGIDSMLNPRDIYTYLRDKGLGHEHALGWMANTKGESDFDPAAVGDQGTSIGLNQWHGPRAEALRAAVPDWETNWQGQIDYGLGEPETASYMQAEFSDPASATDWFVRNWERPARPGEDSAKRIGFLPELESAIGGGQPMQPMQPIGQGFDPSNLGYEQVQREPTMGERLASDPWLQMGLGILGARGGSGIQNIASGAQQGLANVNKAEAAVRQQQSAAMLRNFRRQQMQQSGNLQNQRMQQARRAAVADPSRIREVRKLVGMGTPLEQAKRMIYPTGTSSGRTLDEQGGVVYEKIVSPSGTTGWSPMEDQEQGRRELVLSDESRAKARGSGLGALDATAVDQYGQASTGLATGLSRVNRVLDSFESGALDNVTGPLSGYFAKYFSPAGAVLELEGLNALIDNVQVSGLTPVSNADLDTLRGMFASPFKNKAQNIAVLRRIKKNIEDAAFKTNAILQRLAVGEPIESIRANPPELNFEPGMEGGTQETTGRDETESAVPQGRPMSDMEFTEMLERMEAQQ